MPLFKKLDDISELMKQFNASIKQPKMGAIKPPKPASPKLPGNPSKSQKDPVKMAQQVQNPAVKPIAVDAAKQSKEALKISQNGQWKLKSPSMP